MHRRNGVLLVMLLILFVFPVSASSEVIDRIVAVVNEDIITLVELNKAIDPYLPEVEKTAYSDEQKEQIIQKLQKDMLTKLIGYKLTEQEAERLGLKVSENELKTSIEKFMADKNLTREQLEKVLLKEKMTYAEFESDARSKILRPKLINLVIKAKVVITNEEIKEYYDDHDAEYKGVNKYHLKNILVDSEQEIQRIKTLLDEGNDFKETATLYSKAPNASNGGELGAFEIDVFADDIRENILLLENGQYTDIIFTSGGFQIFYLEKIEISGGTPLEQAKDEISSKLFSVKAEKKYSEWLDELKERSHIKTTL